MSSSIAPGDSRCYHASVRRRALLSTAGLVLAVAVSSPAHADRATQLVARGEQLAKDGQLDAAIVAFKDAERARSRASHACLIALAYIRLQRWPQAEIYLDACRVRSSAKDPLPKWFALAHQQLVEQLDTADVAAVEIRIEPVALADTAAIGVSTFAPDEQFAPQTIHLPRGKHVITATVEGNRQAQQTIEVTGTSRLTVAFDFRTDAGVAVIVPARPVQPKRRVVPWTVTASGGVVLAAAAAYHLFAFKPVRDKLIDATDDTPDPALYDEYEGKFDTRRTVTIALYGVGAAALITGLVLLATTDADERPARLTYDATHGGAIVGLEWSR